MNLSTPLVTYDASPTGEYILSYDGSEISPQRGPSIRVPPADGGAP